MNGLIDDGAPTVEGEGPFPASIIGGGTMPLNVGAREHESAEATRVQGGFHGLGAHAEASLEDGREAHAGDRRGLDNFVNPRGGYFERFFNDHMFARADGGEGRGEVSSAGGRDTDDLNIRSSEQGGDVGGGEGHAMFRGEGGDIFLRAAGDADEFSALRGGDRLSVKAGDHAGANDTKAKRCCGHRESRVRRKELVCGASFEGGRMMSSVAFGLEPPRG